MKQELKNKIEIEILQSEIDLATEYHKILSGLHDLATISPLKPDEIMVDLSTSKQRIVDMTTELMKLKGLI